MAGSPISPALWGIPLMRNSAERDGTFPTPALNQRVHNLQTGSIQRWNGASWVDDFFSGSLSIGTPAVNWEGVQIVALPQVLDFKGRVDVQQAGPIAEITVPELPIENAAGAVVVAKPSALKFAGTGVVVSAPGGDVALMTITAGGGVAVQDEGAPVVAATTMNFKGAAIAATTPGAGVADVTVTLPTPTIVVADEGVPQLAAAALDFVGDGVVASDAGGGIAQVTIPGTTPVEDEGAPVLDARTLNFVGTGVVASDAGGGVALITIPGPIAQPPIPDGGWWMADAGIGVADGAPVPSWVDQSVAGLDLTPGDVGATAPTFIADEDGDGLPLVRFDGIDNQLSLLSIGPGAADELTIALVFRTVAVDGGARRAAMALCPGGGDQSSDSWRANVMATPGFQVGYKFDSVGAFYNAVAVGASQNNEGMNDGAYEWTIALVRWKNILGTGVITVREGLASASYDLGDVCRVQPYTNFYLGSGSTGGVGGTGYNTQDVRECMIYRSGLPDSSVRTLLRYLGNKWQIPGFI